MPKIQASEALAPLRVLDLSRVRAGPTCVRMLADFGADVIRIEPPPGIDANESMFADNRMGGDFQNLNRNKRSLTLNLKQPDGLAVFMRLVKTADVVVENWRPDVKTRLGLDYEALQAVNPRIILASISGYGQDGPYAWRPGFDQVIQGMGGLMSVTGHGRTGTDARGPGRRRFEHRPVRRARHLRRAAGARAIGAGPVGAPPRCCTRRSR